MNIPAFTIGIVVSIFLIGHFKKSRLESSKFTYAFLLITFPLYYFAFAVYVNDYAVIPLELMSGLVFFGIAILSLRLTNFYKFNLLALGYLLHGIYDIIHHMLFINAGTPVWWPEFCGVIDIIIGLYLMNLAFKLRDIAMHHDANIKH
ncbi:DUF6010 family protein [Pseudoalteromonas sp. H105]|uniref:DUF6010 family protein n=1 Tax=Pseudoalteromonas sp. H105 TaxID=1348393 RepID=UPI000731F186|nr:DUF6010 family protein [Pseudoalteromonas sp. H105]KTF18373.1 hypothetical protein ATS75_02890 [Pseudoalteromonas sp. H105]